jgi:hypothetical protein
MKFVKEILEAGGLVLYPRDAPGESPGLTGPESIGQTLQRR